MLGLRTRKNTLLLFNVDILSMILFLLQKCFCYTLWNEKKLYSGANDERNIEKHEQEKNSNNLFVRRVLKWKSSTRHILGRRRTRLFFWSPQFFGEAIRVRDDLLHPPKFEDLYLQESLNFCKNVVKTFSFGALTFDKKKTHGTSGKRIKQICYVPILTLTKMNDTKNLKENILSIISRKLEKWF